MPPDPNASASYFSIFKLGLAGEVLATALGITILLIGLGRLLKRRFGTRLGRVYQLFCPTLAAFLAIVAIAPGLPGRRELGAASTLLGASVLVRLLDQYLWGWYFERQRKAAIPKFVRDLAAVALMILAVLLVLEFDYGVLARVPGLLAASGVVGIILGFALQDSLGNIIAGFAIQIGRPFQVDDWLLIEGQHVKAIEINWRSSRFVTNDEVQLEMPNQQIIRQTLVNYHGGGSRHAMRFEIGIQYEAPPNRVKDILSRAASAAPGVLQHPLPNAFLKSFGDSAITYEVRFWLEDHRLYNMTSDAVRTNIWYALRRERIQMPYPIRTLHLERTRAGAPGAPSAAHGATQKLLRAQPLFAGMGEEHLRELVERSPIHHYGRGEAIIHEGADGSSMFVLVSGEAGVALNSSGQSTRVATLHGGDCFGELSLLTGEKRSASVLAIHDCEVLEVTKSVFGDIIARDTGLLPRLSELLARRQMETEGIVQARAQETAAIAEKEEEYRAGFLSKLTSFFAL